jgi:hypothetical protein
MKAGINRFRLFYWGRIMLRWALGLFLGIYSLTAAAIAPYIQGDKVQPGDLQTVAAVVEGKLKAAGFKPLGHYFPKGIPGRGVIVVSDDAILAKVRDMGGTNILAAPIRIGVSADGAVSYINLDYWYRAYLRHRFNEVAPLARDAQGRLARALGAGPEFGGDEAAAELPRYRYMVGMERFEDEKNRLARHSSFAEALETVRHNLARGVADTSKVYEIVVPEKKVAVFGVAMHSPASGDAAIVNKINVQDRIAALPYELFIVNNEVMALYGRYRLALSFPDLSMGHFTRIVYAPEDIRNTLMTVAGGAR